MTINGGTPYIQRGGQEDLKRIMKSDIAVAATIDVSIPAGFGVIPAGAIMAKISESTNRIGKYIPYVPRVPSAGLTTVPGAAYLVQDGAANTSAYVTMNDSYKFAVGDHLVAVDSDASPVDLGAITAIDRTTYSHMALITVTNNVTTGITIAKGGLVTIQSLTTTPFVQAKGILLGAVDTGVGENAKGGDGVICVKRGEFYFGNLQNYDSVYVASDLSAVVLNSQIITI